MGGGVCALGAAPLSSSSSSCVFAARHPNQMLLLSSPSIKLNRSANKILVIINIQNNPCTSTSTSSTFNNKERTGIFVDSIKCQAQSSNSSSTSSSDNNNTASSPLLYQGAYGPWSVDSSDVTQVILYRTGLVTAAASSVTAASTAFLPDNSSSLLSDIIKNNIDIFYALGAGGLGLSLLLIHIYITEIKRTLQALWAFGILGSFATYFTLAQPAGENLVQYVVHNPSAIWFVGPLFASLTGLVFKEGLCYGKLEAGILTFIIPSLLLGHLSGLMDDGVKVTLLGIWMALFVIFAGRKFTQPIKDDIGDKSVFIFNALPEEQKKALMEKLQQQKFTEET